MPGFSSCYFIHTNRFQVVISIFAIIPMWYMHKTSFLQSIRHMVCDIIKYLLYISCNRTYKIISSDRDLLWRTDGHITRKYNPE